MEESPCRQASKVASFGPSSGRLPTAAAGYFSPEKAAFAPGRQG